MSQQVKLKGFEIEFDDVFNFKGLYKMIYEWLTIEGFITSETEKIMETLYLDINRQGSGQEVWVWWRTTRQDNDFYKRIINIDFHILAMKQVEAVVNGQKIPANKGDLTIFIDPIAILDPEDKWEKNTITSAFLDPFKKRIYKPELEAQETDFQDSVKRLNDAVKQYLEMKAFVSTFA